MRFLRSRKSASELALKRFIPILLCGDTSHTAAVLNTSDDEDDGEYFYQIPQYVVRPFEEFNLFSLDSLEINEHRIMCKLLEDELWKLEVIEIPNENKRLFDKCSQILEAALEESNTVLEETSVGLAYKNVSHRLVNMCSRFERLDGKNTKGCAKFIMDAMLTAMSLDENFIMPPEWPQTLSIMIEYADELLCRIPPDERPYIVKIWEALASYAKMDLRDRAAEKEAVRVLKWSLKLLDPTIAYDDSYKRQFKRRVSIWLGDEMSPEQIDQVIQHFNTLAKNPSYETYDSILQNMRDPSTPSWTDIQALYGYMHDKFPRREVLWLGNAPKKLAETLNAFLEKLWPIINVDARIKLDLVLRKTAETYSSTLQALFLTYFTLMRDPFDYTMSSPDKFINIVDEVNKQINEFITPL